MLIVFLQNSYAQLPDCVLCIDVENVFSVDDTLRLSGTSTPNDTLIAELFNPNGALVSRTQITVGSDGVFSRTLLQWTLPTQNLPFGTYTLIVRSTLNEERRATEVLKFQPAIPEIPEDVGRELAVQISAPSAIGANETAKVIVQVTINNILIKIDPAETLKDSHIHFPDGSIRPIETFAVLEDGIYYTDFTSRMLGHYTIHVQAFQQGLIANSVSVVLVQEGSFSSLSKEVSELNTNVEGLRQETVKKTEELGSSVSRIESASGQVTSLLLPIIGMIAIIVALQATMLARRK